MFGMYPLLFLPVERDDVSARLGCASPRLPLADDAANLMPTAPPPPLETPMVPGSGDLDALPTNLPPPDGFALNDTSYNGFLVVLAAADFAGTEENGRKVHVVCFSCGSVNIITFTSVCNETALMLILTLA